MGIFQTLKNIQYFILPFTDKRQKVCFLYPNRKMTISKVDVKDERFKMLEDQEYAVESQATYYYGGKPILLYTPSCASPLKVDDKALTPSMKASEFYAAIESKAAHDLLTGDAEDWIFWICVATLALVVLHICLTQGWIHFK